MTGKLVTGLSLAAASTLAAMALFGATPALANGVTLQHSAADAQPAATGNDELAQQIEQAEERLRQADPEAAADRDTERRIAADRDTERGWPRHGGL
ncbi:hypothetical protein ACIRVF_42800 [Kitasatospora sp. NPDC101157]|uniref:hypothetical protein n=1 Tax=Kitasatospora sp. NPDC101157 TaxID=3364098 RepID=UPI003811154D